MRWPPFKHHTIVGCFEFWLCNQRFNSRIVKIAQKNQNPPTRAAFAKQNIAAGTRIAVFTGETYLSDTALGLPSIMRDHAIQVGPREFVFGYKGLAHCLCHSCNPNCGIRNLTEIFAVRDIAKGEQLTWDYRCSENSNWILEKCLCGADRCTGTVANFDSLSPDMKSEYLSKSMVSEWIVSTL